jgi:SAM-dependent methyltransferase
MLTRRTLLASTTAVAALGAAEGASAKPTDAVVDVKMDPFHLTPRQQALHPGTRFPKLANNSEQDFCYAMRQLSFSPAIRHERELHIEKFLRAQGLNSLDDTDMSYEEAYNLMLKDPMYAMSVRISRSIQHLMWDRSMRAFHGDRERYLAALEATDHSGPGSLELNPDLDMPDYTRHEIHTQPGGYVGDPFAGFAYNYALDAGFHSDYHAPGKPGGENGHDEMYIGLAQAITLPADGQVRRILDLGCGTGQFTTSLKERFPNAEVWGIDVGAPMVRYAHYRAVHMNLDVHFAHRLAEDTRFPDGHFDIVTDHIMFHEVTGEAARQIVAEAKRVLRPGGVFHHLDVLTSGEPTPLPSSIPGKAGTWVNHRHNIESWSLQYIATDFPGLLRETGFEVKLGPPLARAIYPGVLAIKPA